ncbi:MAG TPA: NAD-dependent epimerase/dehydratase family protein, partial [Microvirga sp.]|nr:NAD-dependent epimerase/dehydratase family protein [Microvirga sp.]
CIGGAIAEALLWRRNQGLDVSVVVTGRRPHLLARRYAGTGAQIVAWDLASVHGLSSLDVGLPPTMAVHAASPASPRDYLARPVDTLASNVYGISACAAMLMAEAGTAGRLLYISSGEIYGSPGDGDIPTPESYLAPHDHLQPRACYTEAKRHGESLCLAWHRQHGLQAVISRPIHIYGPGLRPDDGRVVCDFVSSASHGRAITMLSDGSPRRAFCYLSDATRAHLLLLSRGRGGEAYNVGREDPEVSIRELAEVVRGAIAEVPVSFGAASHTKGSPHRSCPSMAKLNREFGYAPMVDLPEGLRRLSCAFREGRYDRE